MVGIGGPKFWETTPTYVDIYFGEPCPFLLFHGGFHQVKKKSVSDSFQSRDEYFPIVKLPTV